MSWPVGYHRRMPHYTASPSSIHARRWIPLIALAALLAGALPACSTAADTSGLHMLPMDQMPAELTSLPVTVETAYRFVAANPDLMQNIPCYCGCGGIGHTSNYSCYVTEVDSRGAIHFDGHALGCSICVDITLDAIRLLKQGKSVPEIRAFVDATYSKYGTSNMQ